mgnify:CR=1 FL=1
MAYIKKIKKIDRYFEELILDHNYNQETNLEYIKDFIFEKPNVDYQVFATRFGLFDKRINKRLKKYNLKVTRGSKNRFRKLIEIENKE